MNELIKVNYENDQPTVLGRDLHEALEVKPDIMIGLCECVSMGLLRV